MSVLGLTFDLLTFRAFSPSLTDSSYPLLERFQGRRLLGLTFGLKTVYASVLSVGPQRELQWEASQPVPDTPNLPEQLKRLAAETGVEHAMIGLSRRIKVRHLESAFAGSREDYEFAMTENPQKLIGAPAKRSEIYTVVRHPTQDHSIVFTLPREAVDEATDIVRLAGLECVRLVVSPAAILNWAVNERPAQVHEADVFMIIERSAVLFLYPNREGGWARVACRNDIKADDPIGVIQDALLERGAPRGELQSDSLVRYLCTTDFKASSELPKLLSPLQVKAVESSAGSPESFYFCAQK